MPATLTTTDCRICDGTGLIDCPACRDGWRDAYGERICRRCGGTAVVTCECPAGLRLADAANTATGLVPIDEEVDHSTLAMQRLWEAIRAQDIGRVIGELRIGGAP